MAETKTNNEKDEERLKRIMKAATGCVNVEDVRKNVEIPREGTDSAKEFLRDMENEVTARERPEFVLPNQKDDAKLKAVSLAGPEPKPPAPRNMQPYESIEIEQGTNVTDASTPQRRDSDSEKDNTKRPQHSNIDEQTMPVSTSATIPGDSKDNDLNYNWISIIYAIGSLLTLVLYLLEHYGSRPQRSFVASLDDMYIVFLPYVPCLIWTLTRLYQQRTKTERVTIATEKKNQ